MPSSEWLGWAALGAIVMVSALLGMLSNRIRAHWGLILLPAEVGGLSILILLVAFLSSPEVPEGWSLKDLVNSLLWGVFPSFVVAAPPFLIGRYVPQVLRAAKGRRRASEDV